MRNFWKRTRLTSSIAMTVSTMQHTFLDRPLRSTRWMTDIILPSHWCWLAWWIVARWSQPMDKEKILECSRGHLLLCWRITLCLNTNEAGQVPALGSATGHIQCLIFCHFPYHFLSKMYFQVHWAKHGMPSKKVILLLNAVFSVLHCKKLSCFLLMY